MSFVSKRTVLAASLVLSGGVVAACGGADAAAPKSPASEPASPAPPPGDAFKVEDEPKNVQEAQDRIARAQLDLNGGPGAGGGASPATPSSEAKPSQTAPKADPAPRVDRPNGEACASSCRALASMRRAVTALCRMTGDGDNRCTDARRTLADNEAKVTVCKCS